MFIIGMSIIVFLGWFVCYDYYLSMTGSRTFSTVVYDWTQANLKKPHVLISTAVTIGLTIGFVLGFILGHLFWPHNPS